MPDFDENMNKIFDVPYVDVTSNTSSNTEIVSVEDTSNTLPTIEKDLSDDYQTVRDNYQYIVTKGLNAIDEMLKVATDSQHPRAYEVAATLIKNVSEANEKLITLQKQMREMNQEKKTETTNIDKAIFIGNPSELNKLLKGKD